MTIARRIFVSSPRNEYLDDRRNELKWAIVKEIETLGYEAQVFGSPNLRLCEYLVSGLSPDSLRAMPGTHNSFQQTVKKLRFLPSAEFERWAPRG